MGDLDYSESKCLAFSNYKLSVSYTLNATESNNVTYKLQSGGKTMLEESTNELVEEEEFFTVCSSKKDCLDYDGCTEDICNQESRTCENMINSACNSCDF